MKIGIYVLVSILILNACDFNNEPAAVDAGKEIVIQNSSFTLAWDFNTENLSPEERDAVQFFIYARNYNQQNWNLVGVTPFSQNPRFKITEELLDPGRYYFAVSAILDGFQSSLHTSNDKKSMPVGGWNIYWIPTK